MNKQEVTLVTGASSGIGRAIAEAQLAPGRHVGNLANWGVHFSPIPDELQVHNLEDKGVVIQYHCPKECSDLVEKLTAIVKRYSEYVVLAPRPNIDKRIALTAWGKIDKFDEFDEARIVRFIKRFRGIDHHGEG